MDPTLAEFVQHLVDSLEEADGEDVPLSDVVARCGKARSTIVTRANELARLGLARREQVKTGRTWSARHVLLPPDLGNPPEITHPTDLPKALHPPEHGFGQQALELTSDLDTIDLPGSGKRVPLRGEAFSVFCLFAALPARPPAQPRSYVVPMYLGDSVARVEIRPTQGTSVASILDVRILVAVLSVIRHRIEQGHKVRNPFVLHINEVIEVLQGIPQGEPLGVAGSYKRYVLEAINRWESTGFRVTQASKYFAQYYQDTLEIDRRFRIIPDIQAVTRNGKDRLPGVMALHIHEPTLHRLASEQGKYVRAMTQEWISESNPFALRIGTWARRFVHRTTDRVVIPRQLLAREADPLSPPARVYQQMRKLFEARFDASRGCAYLHGYLFSVHDDINAYEFHADPEHPLLGKRQARVSRNK